MKFKVEVVFHKDFVKVSENKIIVGISSKPEKGKANLELIKNWVDILTSLHQRLG